MNEEQHSSNGANGRQPGAALRAAREARGLSVEEIARALHLSPVLIRALEGDEYEALPAATYVRGYLRAYCRQVDIDADPLIEAFEQAVGGVDAPVLEPVTRSKDPLRSHAPRIALMILLFAVILGVLAWWYLGETDNEVAMEAAVEQELPELDDPAPAGMAEEPAPESSVDEDEYAEAAEPEAERADETVDPFETVPTVEEPVEVNGIGEPDATVAEPESEAPAMEEAEPEAVPEDEDPFESAPVDPEEANDLQAADDTESAADLPATTSAADAMTPEASIGPNVLTLAVNGESWIEIQDDQGRQLVYVLYAGDDPLRVRGWAPFHVFLGNSPDVEVRFGNETVDKDAFTRPNGTARFLVDAAGAHPRPAPNND